MRGNQPEMCDSANVRGVLTAALMLLLLSVVVSCSSASSEETGEEAPQQQFREATVRDFPLTVIGRGELEASEQVEIKVQVEGSTTIAEIIPEGTRVDGPRYQITSRGRRMIPGTLLAVLGAEEIDEKIQQEKLSVQQARADKIAAEQALAITRSEAQSSERAARLALELAKLDQQKWASGTDPQRQRELELALETAQRRLERAKRDLTEAQQLYREKFISQGELESAEDELINADNALKTARLNIEVYENFERPKELQKFASDVEQAEAELTRTLKKNEGDLARVTADLASKSGVLALRESRLEKLTAQRRNTRIYAPRDGNVVYSTSIGRQRRWSEPIRQGRQVRYNESLIVLPDLSRMVAAVKVHEARIAQVEIGQEATIEIDAHPGEPLKGTVIFKASNAEDPGWMNAQLREYVVRVELPAGVDITLQPGMNCKGTITTGFVRDELSVPVQAVFTEGKQRYCYIRADEAGKWKRQDVEIGASSESWVVVEKGLVPGQEILLRTPRSSELAT